MEEEKLEEKESERRMSAGEGEGQVHRIGIDI